MPLVDANMRELAATGFMSNRGRQIVASYFALDLGLDWRAGALYIQSRARRHLPARIDIIAIYLGVISA